jgi:uncharacterized protein YejL (UPF0352 family)
MPQTSRFDNNQIETIMDEVLTVFEKHQVNKDLSLVVLGNLVSHVFNTHIPENQRGTLVDTFTKVLHKSIES